jgi:hypothetical protein
MEESLDFLLVGGLHTYNKYNSLFDGDAGPFSTTKLTILHSSLITPASPPHLYYTYVLIVRMYKGQLVSGQQFSIELFMLRTPCEFKNVPKFDSWSLDFVQKISL